MPEINPRLYSISTVCLLKHYNQDYLLHTLRTDFTGSNGVGKSIIADLFQIVFIADTRHIKFATEGTNKKLRKIETMPYESGIGYVFFNVEVTEGNFITIGAAIFAQGNNVVRPFIITSSINFEKDSFQQNTFKSDKLLFSGDFLKPNKEAHTLDDLARIAPEKHKLYIHYFGTREERATYYDWLYQNELLSINLVKEGNLKAFAKVIQSFSKSKSLDIDSSKSLIEYLFEEDEIEIGQEYTQQEQAIRKLLHNFKTTKVQINDIASKQNDLLKLKGFEAERKEAEHELDFTSYILAHKNRIKRQGEFSKIDNEINNKNNRLKDLLQRSDKFSSLVKLATTVSEKENKAFGELAGSQALFSKMEQLKEEETVLDSIDTDGLFCADPENPSDLLGREVRLYSENISKSEVVLRRYASMKAMEDKKKEQDRWLKEKMNELEDKEKQLTAFQGVLKDAGNNSFFIKTLSAPNTLTKPQQAVLVYLRNVLLSRPALAAEGTRYAESVNLINELEITEDKANKGWWLKTGQLYEFVPETPLLLPDLSKIKFTDTEQLKKYLEQQHQELKQQKSVYDSLSFGIKPKGFSEYDFDENLSDPTKVSGHKLAAQLCALVAEKIGILKGQQKREIEKIEEAKRKYGIADDAVEYGALLNKTRTRSELFKNRRDKLEKKFSNEQTEIGTIQANLPFLDENHKRSSLDLENAEKEFARTQESYQAKYPEKSRPDVSVDFSLIKDIAKLQEAYKDAAAKYINEYNQIIGKYDETKDHRDIRVNEQVSNQNFSFEVLEQALLGNKIRTLDEITGHLESLNAELLTITDELLRSLVKVFGKTEAFFDKYKGLVDSLNDFFRGKLISERFYFRIDFNPAPKLDIKWIEYLRKSAHSIVSTGVTADLSPEQFIEDFYMKFSGNKSRIVVEELLNPKRYFVLKGKLTDENGKEIPGSTGESYTAIALLGIARLSVVQDGDRSGLRFIILEESATLDDVNFGMFPIIAKRYRYQIITMTPKPYAIGGDEGWYIHQLIPGPVNKDINYEKVMSYFRTNKNQIQLDNYLKARQ